MNNFAYIKPLFKYNRVAYYSVSLNDNEKTLYQEFVEKHTIDNKNKLYHIQKWLKLIGENMAHKIVFSEMKQKMQILQHYHQLAKTESRTM